MTTIKPATPLPFRIGEYIAPDLTDAWAEGDKRLYERALYGADQVKVAVLEQWVGDKEAAEAEQNAAYIAHACNAYPRLVAALRGAAMVLEHGEQAQRKPMAGHLAGLIKELGE